MQEFLPAGINKKYMWNKIQLIGIVFFLLCVNFACSERGLDDSETENPTADNDTIVDPLPIADTEKWLYKKNKLTSKEEKFFGIGLWHVPGYTLTENNYTDVTHYDDFKERTASSNIVIIDSRYLKSYMNEKILMIGNFSATLHGYLDKITALPKSSDKDYYRTQYLKGNANNPELIEAFDNEVRRIVNKYPEFERAYFPIDEIALGGVAKWFIPPVIGEKMYESIKKRETNPIVLVDLMGHGRGSTFFFEQNYLKTHASMPVKPPYDLLSEGTNAQKTYPLLGFSQAYDGTPVYKFDLNGNYSYENLNIETLKRIWYENVRQIASAYQKNGNVFSINAFRDFYANPILAGVTTDAMKDGLKEKPIWLYFDGNGYAKPANVTPENYVKNVKCQIYTSIVHGATGIFFWNDWSKTAIVFDNLLPVLKELNENLYMIYFHTIERKIESDLHVMIKRDGNGGKYIIATNTSKTNDAALNVHGVEKKKLNPLEVYVSKIQ